MVATIAESANSQKIENEYRKGWLDGLETIDDIDNETAAVDDYDRSYRDALDGAQEERDAAGDDDNADEATAAYHRGKCHAIAHAIEIAKALGDEPGWYAEAFSWFRLKSEAWRHKAIDAPPPCCRAAIKRVQKVQNLSLGEIAKNAIHADELGFIGQVMKYNLASAPKPQPIFALAGALGLTAAMVGRKVADEFDGRTNLQILVVGETSSGKDFSRQVNDEILAICGMASIVSPEEVTSDTALYKMLSQYPSRLAQFDEFGRFLQTAMTAKTGWLFNVVSALLKLFSSANRQHFVPKTYADRKANPDIEINCPHLVLHATSTPEAIYSGLGTAAEDDGFLGRCLVFESEEQPRKKMRPKGPIPEPIVKFGQYWNAEKQSNLADIKAANPLIIHTTEEAMRVFEEFDDFTHGMLVAKAKGSKLWGRAEQKARQVALVVACSRVDTDDPAAAPIVDEFSARWAVSLVRAITSHMQRLSVKWLASNGLEASHQRMLRIIAASGQEGLSQSELTRKSQWTTRRERQEILATLAESKLVSLCADASMGQTAADARWRALPGASF